MRRRAGARGAASGGAAFAPGTAVVVYLHTPREKFFGLIGALQPAGVVVRGIDLSAFDDWLRQQARGESQGLGLATLFFPMNRVERIERDQSVGGLEGLAERFRRETGRTVAEAARRR